MCMQSADSRFVPRVPAAARRSFAAFKRQWKMFHPLKNQGNSQGGEAI